ncbi:MAG TPA: serine hydrolase domain-containing protein [Chloroflexota bacterium]|nr:serine hydrolase domain-containing protein [Chloroflexota bacterium]
MLRIRHRVPLVATALVLGLALVPAGQAAPSTRAAQPPALKVLPDAVSRVDSYFAAQSRAHNSSGAVLLARGDAVLLSKGYGMADWSRKIHNSSSTQFVLPLMGLLQFATAGLLQLEDAGKLREGDPICAYIPRCPAAWAPITVHELLTSTSGIHDFANDPAFNTNNQGQPLTLAQLMAQIGAFSLDYKPGTNCCSGSAQNGPIEAYMVERISGEPFGTYLQRHFLGPLGLAHTGYFLHYPPALPRLAVGYQSWQAPESASDLSSWGGVIYSTVTDFYRWEHALFTGRVLSAASTAKLLTPAFTVCPPRSCHPYSMFASTAGIFIVTWRGVRSVGIVGFGAGATGGMSEFAGSLDYFPAANITIIVFENLFDYTWFQSEHLTPLIFG